jgi:hypothetical protein
VNPRGSEASSGEAPEASPELGGTAVLARLGFRIPERSLRELDPGWSDDARWQAVLTALGNTADPDGGLRRLRRLGDDLIAAVLDQPLAARRLLEVVGFGEYLTDLCARTPGPALEIIRGAPTPRDDLREFRDSGIVHIAADDLAATPTTESFRAS